MDLKEYANLVDRMRKMQQRFFRTKNQTLLAECKELEQQVDRETDALVRPVPQPGLFDRSQS